MSLEGHDCNDVIPLMENWLNVESEWAGQHGSASTAPLFYDITQASTTGAPPVESLFAVHKETFLKLDTLELCNDAEVLVRTGSSSMVDSSSNEDEITSVEHTSPLVPSLLSVLDHRADLGMDADSPRGPLSPAALQLGMSPRPTAASVSKRPFDDLQPSVAFAPFVTVAGSPAFNVTPAAAAGPGIIFPAPLALPTVPSLEEIAQSRPKRRNVRISKDPQSVAARHRRERISDRVRVLQHFVPGGTKMDTASMLDEAIQYVKFLQHQLQTLERLGNASYDPRFMPSSTVMMSTTNAAPRPFDLNCAVYHNYPMMHTATSPSSSSQAQTSWQTNQFYNQDSAQEQFCH